MPFNDEDFLEVCEEFRRAHQGKTAEVLTARYNEVVDRLAELKGYARRSNAQDYELSRLHAEQTVLDVEIGDRRVAARSQLAAERPGRSRRSPAWRRTRPTSSGRTAAHSQGHHMVPRRS